MESTEQAIRIPLLEANAQLPAREAVLERFKDLVFTRRSAAVTPEEAAFFAEAELEEPAAPVEEAIEPALGDDLVAFDAAHARYDFAEDSMEVPAEAAPQPEEQPEEATAAFRWPEEEPGEPAAFNERDTDEIAKGAVAAAAADFEEPVPEPQDSPEAAFDWSAEPELGAEPAAAAAEPAFEWTAEDEAAGTFEPEPAAPPEEEATGVMASFEEGEPEPEPEADEATALMPAFDEEPEEGAEESAGEGGEEGGEGGPKKKGRRGRGRRGARR